MNQDYSLLAQFYRQMVRGRGFFAAEQRALEAVFRLYGIPKDARVLDAACGTGDVACALAATGMPNIHALDGSADMMRTWPRETIPVTRLSLDWANLPEYMKTRREEFDVVFFLGHSLPHADAGEIPIILEAARSGLLPSGILLFDVRPWSKDLYGRLAQSERAPETTRSPVAIDGKTYSLTEQISYDYESQRQIVEYHLVSQDSTKQEISTRVTYSLFDWRQAAEWMTEAGFCRDSVVALQFPSWPYVILVARNH